MNPGVTPETAPDPKPTPYGRPLARGLAVGGLVSLALITLVPPASTRMHAFPWTIAYAVALATPVLLLILRAFDPDRPLALPSRSWQAVTAAMAAVLLASALASPHRGPSLQWCAPLLSALAVFLLAHDASQANARPLTTLLLAGFAVIGLTSVALWAHSAWGRSPDQIFDARNAFPLGHSNYTAGFALLMLPVAGGRLCRGHPGRALAGRTIPVTAILLGLTMLFTSGSRGGAIALSAAAAAAIALAPVRPRTKLLVAVAAIATAVVFVAANPRTRAMLAATPPGQAPNPSNVQRSAMLLAGQRMGLDRALLGWGPGTTPLVFPQYRAGLDGGAENVLQLHSTPIQIWAELGAAGVTCALAGVLLMLRDARRQPAVAAALIGYSAFSVFDWQIDVPALGFAIAALAGLLARPGHPAVPRAARRPPVAVGAAAIIAAVTVLGFGRPDPTPRLNVDALVLAAGGDRGEAVRRLRASLARNPDQEIAHFNLGWLLVVDDPAAAARHFTSAARLVPDKGGVYFGLGLARLNGGDRDAAVHAFALEAVNDPAFLLSPWWKSAALEPLRPSTEKTVTQLLERAAARLPTSAWAGREARYLQALSGWLAGDVPPERVAAAANTPGRSAYFSGTPSPAELQALPSQVRSNERIGYPVLVRNLDLRPPTDAWTVPESSIRHSPLAHLLPPKGWCPSPLLLELLRAPPEDLTQTSPRSRNP